MSLGFIVGKFYPPHRGHKHLIDSARAQVDHLVVVLAHHPSQKIPGELRKSWLEEIHPDCEIHLVPDELDNDSAQWAKWTLDYLGRAPDVVFTSEDYGPVYAAFMDCRHVMIDRNRSKFPVSGTQVRQAPLQYLGFLEPCVRACFVRRVVLIGAESTGKTTLARLLADRFQTNWVPEYGREHWEKKVAGLNMTDPLPSWSHEEFIQIATEQQRRENLAARTANKVLICDTNAFATGTWYERYYHAREPRVDEIGRRDRAHLYILAGLDVPFEQDGFRDGELIRGWMHNRFRDQLMELSLPHVEVSGSIEVRVTQAGSAIDELINSFSID